MSNIIFVCEGNVCRSPLAERLLSTALAAGGSDVSVASAGTRALVGWPMDDDTGAVLARLGGDPTGHQGRLVSSAILEQATLVLTATREQRSAVVQIRPRAVKRTFTIRQLGRILDLADTSSLTGTAPQERLEALISLVVQTRGQVYQTDPTLDDLEDPHRQPLEVHERVAQQILPTVNHLAQALGGSALSYAA